MGFFDELLGEDFLGDTVDGFVGTDYLKDYSHASKLFRSDNFALAPKQKFQFHVYFNLNIKNVNEDLGLIGALVKTVQLPSFNLDTQEYIQYNRKRNIHSKISYNPVRMTLHDDSGDNIRSLWHNYYRYYFADADYGYNGTTDTNETVPSAPGLAYNPRNIYDADMNYPSWGMSSSRSNGLKKQAFFKDIIIYGFSNGNFVTYTLINPMIKSWAHDTYSYSEGAGLMEHTVELSYEAVKYGRGTISSGAVLGHGKNAPQRYDTSPSPLSKPGSTASIFGAAGALDAATGAIDDLANGNILGAIKKVGTTYKTFKGKNVKQIIKDEVFKEARDNLPGAITNIGKTVGIIRPKGSSSTQPPAPVSTAKPAPPQTPVRVK